MAKRARKSTEERKAEATALREMLAAKVEQLRTSDEWARMLDGVARLHRYSLGNLLLILSQCPEATDVRTFQAWKREGRPVRKGETGIRIFRPMVITVDSEDADEASDGEDGKRVIFRPMSVFNITQVEGAEDDPTAYRTIEGRDDAGIYTHTAAVLEAQGWTVTEVDTLGGPEGMAKGSTRTVDIVADLTPAQKAVTILHEAAHVMLGHCDADTATHRGAAEVAAESVAYVVASAFGIDSSVSSVPYVAGWAQGEEGAAAIYETAADVLRVAHHLIEALESDAESGDTQAA